MLLRVIEPLESRQRSLFDSEPPFLHVPVERAGELDENSFGKEIHDSC